MQYSKIEKFKIRKIQKSKIQKSENAVFKNSKKSKIEKSCNFQCSFVCPRTEALGTRLGLYIIYFNPEDRRLGERD
jgi:hypothetical protein